MTLEIEIVDYNELENNLFELVEITKIEKGIHSNVVDLTIEDDETFVLSNGIISHNSANAPLLDASNPKVHGLFPLKSKPENCYAKKLTDVVSQEIMYISRILNLSITKPDYDNMRYDKIVFATDADTDGQHIIGLLSLLFSRFRPELLKEGRVQIFQTPSVIATYKGKKYNFVREAEYDERIKDKKGYTTKYCKGLGGHDSKTFSEFLNDPKSYITIDYNPERDDDALGTAFDPKRADDRKEWVAII